MSKAFPIAVALLVVCSIWSNIPDMVLCMDNIIFRVDSIVSIITGNCSAICGRSSSSLSRFATRSLSLSDTSSTPSRVSKTERRA
ncbi:Uncharacterised protein [Mycobacteroides abscessus]|nr:Uncharacterised protein [Mycobacteroides abscessus]